eukprot:6205783-Pleurochrysis_carterae.AAC.2
MDTHVRASPHARRCTHVRVSAPTRSLACTYPHNRAGAAHARACARSYPDTRTCANAWAHKDTHAAHTVQTLL